MQIVRVLMLVAATMPPALASQTVTTPAAFATPTTAELRGLSVPGDRVFWASGQRGTFVRSTDGGTTWTADTIPGATQLDFRAIHAFDDRRAVVASAGEAEKGQAQIHATRDGGRTWTRVFSTGRTGVFLDALVFWDASEGLALSDPVNGRFALVRTRDGGATWTLDTLTGPATLQGEAAFAASGSNLVAIGRTLWLGTGGGTARVHRSDDRGRTWASADVPVYASGAAAGIFAIAFADSLTGIAVGGDYTRPTLAAPSVALTRDGGRTWRVAHAPPGAYLSGVAYAGSAGRVIATGLAGTFLSNDGGDSWTRVDTIPMNGVRFRGAAGFLAGPRGRVRGWTP